MRGALNDGLRELIGVCLRMGGALAEIRHRIRARGHPRSRARLRERLEIRARNTARDGCSSGRTAGRFGRRADRPWWHTHPVRVAIPKRLVYCRRRLAMVRRVFIESFMRLYWMLGVRRTSLYVFGPLEGDESLTGLLLNEVRLPGYLTTLQAPYRMHASPALPSIGGEIWLRRRAPCGSSRSRTPGCSTAPIPPPCRRFWTGWIPTGSGVALSYGTVCSIRNEWVSIARTVTRRLASCGCAERLEAVARSRTSLPVSEWAPAASVYVCWTGGYVAPFLDRLAKHLPAGRFRLVPMYSMSTETIATVPDFRAADLAFLPMAPGVYYEFLAPGIPAENLAGCSPRSSSRSAPPTKWSSATGTA